MVEHGRLGDPMMPSQAEAKQAGEQAQQWLTTSSAATIQQAQDSQAMQASSDAVSKTIFDQLQATGRFRQAVNEGYATWAAAFYTTMAGRLGLTPEQMHAKYPLRIVGETGQGVTLDQPGSANFDKWFGASKVMDAQGKPLVVYHGTASRFNAFDHAKVGSTFEVDDSGFFFTNDKELADKYADAARVIAKRNGQTPEERTIDAYVSLQNPWIINVDTDKKSAIAHFESGDGQFNRGQGYIVQYAMESGYDGVIIQDKRGLSGHDALIIAFRPEQIKSSTGNSGAFDPNDPSILKQSAQNGGVPESNAPGPQGGERTGANQGNAVTESNMPPVRDGFTRLYHAGSDPITGGYFQTVPSGGVFDGMFALTTRFGNYGTGARYFADIADDKILTQYDLDYETSYEDAVAALKKAMPWLADDDIDFAYEAVIEDKHNGLDGDELQRVFREDDFGAASWEAQRVRGQVAKALGYEAVQMSDENGTSTLIVAGTPLTRVISDEQAASGSSDALSQSAQTDGPAGPSGMDRNTTGAPVAVGVPDPGRQPGPTPRGTFNPASLELALNKSADLTSFFHETGHFFLEVMADLASQPNAPAEIAQDMVTVLAWFGVPSIESWQAMTLNEQRPYHERFAESIEQYVMEGNAPSVELQPLFRKFRAWVLNVYRSAKAFIDGRTGATEIQLSDEVRQVFDRMLASQEQIKQAEEVAGMMPSQDASAEAVERLTARSMRDLAWTVRAVAKAVKALQKEAVEARKEVEAEVTAEVEAMPVYQAKEKLDALQVNPDHAAAAGIWLEQRAAALAEIEAKLKADLYAANPDAKGLQKGQLFAKNKKTLANQAQAQMIVWEQEHPKPVKGEGANDMDLAVIADSFGFPDADTMLQAISDTGPKAALIEGMTDQRMLEQHGELVDPASIQAAANQAVHNEARARSLATELKAQAEMLNPRQDTGQANAAGSKITVNVILEAAKQFAARIVAGTPLKDMKNKAWQHTAAERRAATAWQKATMAGDTAGAVKAKQDQVLNNAAAKAAMDAMGEAKKILEFFKRVVKDGNEKTVEKGRDPDVVNAARAVLAMYGVGVKQGKSAIEYMKLLETNDPLTYAAVQDSLRASIDNAQPLASLTMEQLQGLHEEIQSMWHLAQRTRQMEVQGKLMDIDDAADELGARMAAIGVPLEAPGTNSALTPAETRTRWLQFAGSILRRVEQWAEGMDGKYGGPFLKLVFGPVKAAADAYRTDKVVYRKAYQALLDAVAPSLRKGLIEAPELGYTFGKGHNGIGHAELLHAVLHTGNESNKRKLLLGRGWATENADGTMETAKWDAFIQRAHDTGLLGKVHYDFAQGVWDLLEQTKPLAQRAHRDVFGRYFAEVTADAFGTPFGNYRGGYVPAQADPRIVQDADLRALASLENESLSFSFPATNKGFTKGRVEYNRPLMLDLRTLAQHIDKVLLFAHMEVAVRDVNKLLSRKPVSQPLGKIDPTVYAGMLVPWLNRSARQVVETPIVGDGGISRVLSAARSRAGMALMFANISNTLQQVTGFAGAFAKLKADGMQSSMTRATALFISAPKKMAQAVAAASPFMASRMDNEIAAMNDAMNAILLDPSLYERAQAWTMKHAYFLQSALDNTMGPIIWTSAYNGALGKGLSQDDAVRYADGVIRQTQGSTLPEDVSRIETGPAYARVFTQFIGYFNMMANTNGTQVKQIAQDVGLKRGAGKALMLVTLGMMVPIWVAEAIAQAMRGGPDDPEGDGWLDDWLAAVFGLGTIKGMFAMVPFVGSLANAAVNRFNGNPADDKMSLSPAVSLLEGAAGVPVDIYKTLHGEGNTQRTVRDVASMISILTGLPAIAAARPLGYLAGVEGGQISPTGPADAVRGALTGTASPASKNR